jgi:hypothetical protein
MLKIPVQFLTVYSGQSGYMLLHDLYRTVVSVNFDDDTVVPDDPPYSYITTGVETQIEPILGQEEQPPAPQNTHVLLEYELRRRFTTEEKVALYDAAKTNTVVQVWLDDLRARGAVDLQSQEAIDAFTGLVALGVLTQERSDEITSA